MPIYSTRFIDPAPGEREYAYGKPINIVADINNDGLIDMVTFPTNFAFLPRLKPIVWKNNGDGSFSYATDELLKNADAATGKYGIEFVRDVVEGDFNSDGIQDYMLIDQGYEPEAGPRYFAGNKPHLLLGTPTGLEWAPDPFPDSAVSFNHIGDAADFDGDGDLDLLSASFWNLRIWENDGTGKFSYDPGRLPLTFNRDSNYDPSGATFIKVDGKYQIVVGDYIDHGNGAQNPQVLIQNSKGNYVFAYDLERPNMPYNDQYGAVDMDAKDINNDGRDDLIITWENLNSDKFVAEFEGYSDFLITFFMQDENGKLIASHDRDIMTGPTNDHTLLQWDDYNGDGYLDFSKPTHGVDPSLVGDLLYLNDGTGHFTPGLIDIQSVFGSTNGSLFQQPYFFDANNDGKLDLVSIRPIFASDSSHSIGEKVTTWLGNVDLDGPEIYRFPDAYTEQTAKMIGAVFGAEESDNPDYLRVGIDLLKQQIVDYEGLGELALKVVGAQTNRQVVATLWENIVGTNPSQAEMSPYLDMLSSGMSQGELAVLAADTDLNFNNVAVTMVGIDWSTYGVF